MPGREGPTISGCENEQIVAEFDGGFQESQMFLKGLCMDFPIDELTLSSGAGAAAQKVPGTYGEGLNCLASGRGLEGNFLLDKCCQRPLLSPPLLWYADTGGHHV